MLLVLLIVEVKMAYGVTRYTTPKIDPICTLPIDHRDQIVKDLSRKTPRGPVGDLSLYKDDSKYRTEFFKGYSPDVLFRLGVRDKDSLRVLMCNILYPGYTEEKLKTGRKTGPITRCVNRVWPILRSAVLSVKAGGGPGVYEIYDYRFGLYSFGTMGYVYADDMSTASIIGKTVFGFMVPDDSVRVRFIEWENRECADILNLDVIATLSENLSKLTDRKKDLDSALEKNSAHIDALANIMNKDAN